MSRWSDVQNGRVDLIADDVVDVRMWQLYRVLIEGPTGGGEQRAFIVRLYDSNTDQLRMEMFESISDAVDRCLKWMKG